MVTQLETWRQTPIVRRYPKPTQAQREDLLKEGQAAILSTSESLRLENAYWSEKLAGAHAQMFTRRSVAVRLEKFIGAISPEFGLWIFDAFRSREAQRALFKKIFEQIKGAEPTWSKAQVHSQTARFVADIDDPTRNGPTPHNTGGAIDLTLQRAGKPVPMGTGFDEVSDLSTTDAFEMPFAGQAGFTAATWEAVRTHRRILFNGLVHVGFVNYREEWWHYDLGDGIWAEELGIPRIYDSLEPQVDALIKGGS